MLTIYCDTYSALDWHDWEEHGRYLRTKNCGIDFTGENPEEAIVRDMLDCLADTGDPGELLEKIKAGGTMFSNADFEGMSIYRTEDNVWICEGNCLEIECRMAYHIESIPDEEIEFLPVIQYICFPKVVPLMERIIGKPKKTYAQAERDLIYSQFSKGPFDREQKIVIISSKALRESEWYKNNMELIERYGDTPDFHDRWHPMINVHKQKLLENKKGDFFEND